MKNFIRDPLFHFIFAAGILFAAYDAFAPKEAASDSVIFVSQAELTRLGTLFMVESGTSPDADDMRGMVADHVRQEALSREARALGLHEGDTVIDRRLAQKMSFMITDLVAVPDPSDEDLRNWYDTHTGNFADPPRITFQHIFLSQQNDSDQSVMLNSLNTETSTNWREMGDPFMLQREYGELPFRETVRHFGGDFARDVFAQAPDGQWRGPIESAFGQHLVRVSALTEAETPPFEAVTAAVEREWRTEKARTMNEDAIDEILNKYSVAIEGITE